MCSVANRHPIYLVAPSPATSMPIPMRPTQDDLRDPLRLKTLIAGDLASQHLRLFDSRIRYWRYYLIIGPLPRWRSGALGQKLLRIVRDNCQPGQRARRGVGRDLYNRCKFDLHRPPTIRETKRLVRVFRSQYGAAARRFWEHAMKDHGRDVLLAATRQLRRPTSCSGFFSKRMKAVADGHARRTFHRLLLTQSEVAQELGHLVLRSQSVASALAKVKSATLLQEDAQRMVLSWLLLSLLYQEDTDVRTTTERRLTDEADDETQQLADCEKQLVRVALAYLKKGVDGLDRIVRDQIVRYLRHASSHSPYRAPIRVSPLNTDGSRRRLFADLRLTTFRSLLRSTRSP